MLARGGLLAPILPEVASMQGVEQPPEHHPEGDVFVHTLVCLEKLDPSRHDLPVAFAVLLHDVAKPVCFQKGKDGRIRFHGHCERGAEMAVEICHRLRRSNQLSETVAWLVRNHLRHTQAPKMRASTLKRFLSETHIDALLEVLRIDAASGSGDLSTWQYCVDRLAEMRAAGAPPQPILRGRDLVALGYRPGPDFGRILDAAFDAQLEGEFDEVEGARRWILARHPLDRGRLS